MNTEANKINTEVPTSSPIDFNRLQSFHDPTRMTRYSEECVCSMSTRSIVETITRPIVISHIDPGKTRHLPFSF